MRSAQRIDSVCVSPSVRGNLGSCHYRLAPITSSQSLLAPRAISRIPYDQIQLHISQQETFVSPHRSWVISGVVITLHPALLPRGLCVILKPVIYELPLYILLTELVFTSLQLLVDRRLHRSAPSVLTPLKLSLVGWVKVYFLFLNKGTMQARMKNLKSKYAFLG